MKITYALALAGMLAFSGSAFAASSTATTTDTTVKPAATAATTNAAKPAATTTTAAKPAAADAQKQAISKKCSADADAKGLHGKDRKKFREQCKTAAMKKS
ncbi:PsiF family protein [Rhizobium miluonense]|uniref:PsiF repeat-containing protein n=1 Tax=Rhizobium miluonense TaxID=411945 RepID=A0A1C3X7T0_9HYPH|nr:PsiF family protein [Rhizobium miluonense]SCB48332.1 psiF repeat-containing protein [Rhizobium miluonense]